MSDLVIVEYTVVAEGVRRVAQFLGCSEDDGRVERCTIRPLKTFLETVLFYTNKHKEAILILFLPVGIDPDELESARHYVHQNRVPCVIAKDAMEWQQ